MTNPSGSSAIKANVFSVDPSITVASITPNTASAARPSQSSSPAPGSRPVRPSVSRSRGMPTSRGRRSSRSLPAQIAGSFALPISAQTGAWTVPWSTPTGRARPRPARSRSPCRRSRSSRSRRRPTVTAGWTVPFSIRAGAEFVAGGTAVQLPRTGSSAISATSVVVVSTGQINQRYGRCPRPPRPAPGT